MTVNQLCQQLLEVHRAHGRVPVEIDGLAGFRVKVEVNNRGIAILRGVPPEGTAVVRYQTAQTLEDVKRLLDEAHRMLHEGDVAAAHRLLHACRHPDVPWPWRVR